jgi:hypothetical protein
LDYKGDKSLADTERLQVYMNHPAYPFMAFENREWVILEVSGVFVGWRAEDEVDRVLA